MTSRAERIPLNTLSIGFGLTGLAGVWTQASDGLGVPAAVAEAFWMIAVGSWIWLVTAHLVRGSRTADTLRAQLRHPVQGPLAAVVPIGGILVGAHLHRYLPVAGTVLTVASIVAAALFAGWILGYWMSGTVPVGAVHGAFLLPTAAAGFLAAGAAATVNFHLLAVGALSAGLLFWVVLFTVIVARLAFASPLPVPLVPTLAILVAPPAVAGSAWFAVNGAGTDLLSEGLLGILVLLLLVQLALLPRYRSVPFSLGYWAFTFSYAAAGRYGMQWLALERPVGWQAFSVAILVAVTLFIAAIGARSVVLVVSDRRRAQAAANKAQLAAAAAQEQPDAAA